MNICMELKNYTLFGNIVKERLTFSTCTFWNSQLFIQLSNFQMLRPAFSLKWKFKTNQPSKWLDITMKLSIFSLIFCWYINFLLDTCYVLAYKSFVHNFIGSSINKQCQDAPQQAEFCPIWKNSGWCEEKVEIMEKLCANTCYQCNLTEQNY